MMRFQSLHMIVGRTVFCGAALFAALLAGHAHADISIETDNEAGKRTITIDGQTAYVYHYGEDVDLPHFDPWMSPSGRAMTVKITDPYPHHRSFWVADERVLLEGQDKPVNIYSSLYSGKPAPEKSKWPVAPYQNRSKHIKFYDEKVDGDTAEYSELLTWMQGETPVLDEVRHYRITSLEDGQYMIDFTVKLVASYGKVTIQADASHYAWPYIRMNDTFNVQSGGGTITNSEGGVNQAGTHDKAARWIDYSAPTPDGGSEGLTCLIHPSNDTKAPLWLTRDYGTWGPRRGEGYHKATFTIPEKESISQRVGLYVHRGDAQDADLETVFEAYSEQ